MFSPKRLATVFLFIQSQVYISITALAIQPRDGDGVDDGFQTSPDISHHWGQYSPFFSVPSDISADTPAHCRVTFAQVLSRHGARDPTASKTTTYGNLINAIKANVTSFTGIYSFLSTYTYTLGADDLTVFGQQEMINSGIKFYNRYEGLAKHETPFFRSSGEARVVESAQNFTQGFHSAKAADAGVTTNDPFPYSILVISEAAGSNNTLNHGLCNEFENDPIYSNIASAAQKTFLATFAPPITARLTAGLPGVTLKDSDTISLMDLCPFNTVATPTGIISPFCALFTDDEWLSYDYYETLNKYYGFSYGNPLGPTQGVGFTNELIARLTDTPVMDATSTNRTLDSSRKTFPLGGGKALYADFSHDNDMTGIFSALGLYNATALLSKTTRESTDQTNGYSAAWTVPFAARAYFEKLNCNGAAEELVRVIVNDRVLPLANFGADANGLVPLSQFVGALTFARGGGDWNQCFV